MSDWAAILLALVLVMITVLACLALIAWGITSIHNRRQL